MFDQWINESLTNNGDQKDQQHHHLHSQSSTSPFQTVLGVSSMNIAVSNPRESINDINFIGDHFQPILENSGSLNRGSHHMVTTIAALKKILDTKFDYAAQIGRFTVIILLQLVMSADLPSIIRPTDYSERIHTDLEGEFLGKYKKLLTYQKVDLESVHTALNQFETAAHRFQNTYNPEFRLALLGHHEFSDQVMELERSFLLPASYTGGHVQDSNPLLQNPFKHVIYGPDPLDQAQVGIFPQLEAAIQVAKARDTHEAWKEVKKELFFVVDALESAACVLDNHLIYTYHDTVSHKDD